MMYIDYNDKNKGTKWFKVATEVKMYADARRAADFKPIEAVDAIKIAFADFDKAENVFGHPEFLLRRVNKTLKPRSRVKRDFNESLNSFDWIPKSLDVKGSKVWTTSKRSSN